MKYIDSTSILQQLLYLVDLLLTFYCSDTHTYTYTHTYIYIYLIDLLNILYVYINFYSKLYIYILFVAFVNMYTYFICLLSLSLYIYIYMYVYTILNQLAGYIYKYTHIYILFSYVICVPYLLLWLIYTQSMTHSIHILNSLACKYIYSTSCFGKYMVPVQHTYTIYILYQFSCSIYPCL